MDKVTPEKRKEYNARFYQKLKENPEKYKARIKKQNEWRRKKYSNIWIEYERNLVIKRKYGLTEENYKKLSNNQNNVCAICEKECSTGRNLAVDHCHETGKIRGLLCRNCNVGISLFKDSSNLLKKAAHYLNKE